MTNAVAKMDAQRSPLAAFKNNLTRMKDAGELDMLPANVTWEAFRNAAVVAVTDNPGILRCDQQSLFRSLRRLAAQGLVPDGREAAIVDFGGKAQAMPMVFGLIKTARNSGEVVSIWAEVVHEGEELHLWIEDGERRFKHEYDPLRRSGEIVGAYAVAKLRDGTIEFEALGRAEIEKRRKVSRTQKGDQPSGVWLQWYAEMAKKTVLRALCKRLPVSSEDMRRIALMAEINPDDEPPLVERAQTRRGAVTFKPAAEPEPAGEDVIEGDWQKEEADAEAQGDEA